MVPDHDILGIANSYRSLKRDFFSTMILTTLANIVIISLCVLVHYEVLLAITNILPRLRVISRLKILLTVLGTMVAHAIEVWIFALGYYALIEWKRFGHLTGDIGHNLLDYVYYSFVTYTSLGFGDILPVGDIRYLSGLEALTGLVLIAWTASFIFVEMQKYWKR